MKTEQFLPLIAVLFVWSLATQSATASPQKDQPTPLTAAANQLKTTFSQQLNGVREQLAKAIPGKEQAKGDLLNQFLTRSDLDATFAKFVVLHDGTPEGLAKFAAQSKGNATLLDQLLGDSKLMLQMVVADGAKAKKNRRDYGPAQYGPAMKIYQAIQDSSERAKTGIMQRLALAIALEHAIPISQTNPTAAKDAPATVDPVNRYRHYESAFLNGELDPEFDRLTTWELRMVVDGDEPDETLAWGREMLKNFRPDHVFKSDFGWRYVGLVSTDVKYGSENVKHDMAELQKYQNILKNGGICGRRAFIGRFVLRSFGVPTIARPSRGHGALAHWTPKGWVVNLGPGWGGGWTKTLYTKDVDFLVSSQARALPEEYLKVKRAQWAGDVVGEKRIYGLGEGEAEFWNNLSLKTQQAIVKKSKAKVLDALGADMGEANEPTVAEKVAASPVKPSDREITRSADGVITIPAAAYRSPKGNTRDVVAMKSFDGGLQVFLPRFFPKGKTVLRGGTWKSVPKECTSGTRLLSDGYGRYHNWGLRVAMTADAKNPAKEIELDLGGGVQLEMVYIKPGSFLMGGENKTDGRFKCVEVPVHEVEITQGFYLGKYEVTQAQYQAVMKSNPSKSTKAPDCPVDNVGESEAVTFCGKVEELTQAEVRLPTEAEWEYASRAGQKTRWFFGDSESELGRYAWFKKNAGGKSHPVGQKEPNSWGLYDIYGNVCERISDKYARNYYSISPKQDPTGPRPGSQSKLEYAVEAPSAGTYLLTAKVVTPNTDQRLNVAINDQATEMSLPFTIGKWEISQPVKVVLRQGVNKIRMWRDRPPQSGIAVKEFMLTPVQ